MRCLYFIFLFHFSQLGDRVCGGPIILGTDFNAETHEPPRDNLDVWLDVLRRLRQGGWSEEEIKGMYALGAVHQSYLPIFNVIVIKNQQEL